MTPTELQARRIALGLSQSQFAAALGVSVRTLQGWEGKAKDGGPRRTPRLSGMVKRAIARLEAEACEPATKSVKH